MPDAQAEGAAPGRVAVDARAAGRTASLVSSVLRGHYGYFGMPHNWPSLNGFPQEVRRIWSRMAELLDHDPWPHLRRLCSRKRRTGYTGAVSRPMAHRNAAIS